MSGVAEINNGRILADFMLYERQAEICKAFANPIRLRIMDILSQRECAFSELQSNLAITKTNLSQQISVLKRAGVVMTRRDGQRIFCSLAIPEVETACQILREVLRKQLQAGSSLVA